MDDEDDGPPMLVSSADAGDNADASLNAEIEGVQIKKVPISIITGQCSPFVISS
jgi:hypothetical protein